MRSAFEPGSIRPRSVDPSASAAVEVAATMASAGVRPQAVRWVSSSAEREKNSRPAL